MAVSLDVDYVTLAGTLGAAVGDTSGDTDTNPDFVSATAGTVTFTPTVAAVQVTDSTSGKTVELVPFPIACEVDTSGRITFNSDTTVTLVDLGSSKVTPAVPRDKAAYNVSFTFVKMNDATVKMDAFGINPSADDADSDGTINLWDLQPLPTGDGGAAIARGQGVPAITSAAAGDVVTFDGTDTAWSTISDAGGLVASDNLSDLDDTATARTNLGLADVAATGSASDLTTGTLDSDRIPDLSDTYAPLPFQASKFTAAAKAWTDNYERTQPTVSIPSHTSHFRPVAVDPNHTGANGTGRLWGSSMAHGWITYSDDDGATGAVTGANPSTDDPAGGALDIQFVTDADGNDWMFLLTTASSQTPCSGEVWRSPAPAADGTGITWTCVWRADGLDLGPGSDASTAPANSGLRPGCFAIDSSGHAFIITYGVPNDSVSWPTLSGTMPAGSNRVASLPTLFTASHVGLSATIAGAGADGADLTAKIVAVDYSCQNVAILDTVAQTTVSDADITLPTGTIGAGIVQAGPALYHSSNIFTATATDVTWTQVRRWPQAKHGHGVRIINGVPWISLGDQGGTAQPHMQFPDIGLWRARSLTSPSTWDRMTDPGSNGSGSTRDCVYFLPVEWNGQTAIIGESDGNSNDGPMFFPGTTSTVSSSFQSVHRIPFTYGQTMRSLALTPDGNLIWAGTSENGAHGVADAIWMSAPPYDTPHLCEDMDLLLSTETLGLGVVSNGYWWAGTYRIKYPTLVT